MNREEIINALTQERDRLDQAIAALGARKARRGPGRKGNGRRRHLSPADRKRISAGMRKSWAARKKKTS